MKKINLVFFSFIFFLHTNLNSSLARNYAITNDTRVCRLGDQLIGYGKAKYAADKFNIPFYLTKFEYSDQLALSKFETNIPQKNNWKVIPIKDEKELTSYLKNAPKKSSQKILFLIGILTRISETTNYIDELYLATCQNKKLKDDLKKALQPVVPVCKINLPTNMITVAVHIRKSSGIESPLCAEQYFDDTGFAVDYDIINPTDTITCSKLINTNTKSLIFPHNKKGTPIDKEHPNKFPPEQYYVNQIKKLSEMLHEAPLFVYIFTDDARPKELVERLKKAINKKNIVFATRETENNYLDHLFDDLVGMAQFDCLIRAFSGYSFLSQFLGSHKIIFSPWHSNWITEQKFFIDKISIFLNKPHFNDPNKVFFDLVFKELQG